MDSQAPQCTPLENLIKALLKRLEIPPLHEIHQIHTRLDRLEKLLYQKSGGQRSFPGNDNTPKSKIASTIVLELIARHPNGIEFKAIREETGFNDKKLRNIIYRLDRTGKIQRIKRGFYKLA